VTLVDVTLRDFFAVQAPKDPESWWTFEFSEPLVQKPAGAKWCLGCWNNSDCEKTPECLAMQEFVKLGEAQIKRSEKAKATAWPYAWADAMIEAREEKKP
jgi:hypothetical protein